MKKSRLLEIACFDSESAVIAQDSGADRIEFCADYSSGGITPSFENLNEIRKLISIPLFVMIRPRVGNYIYSDSEFESMKDSIAQCRVLKVDGVVTGILTPKNMIDIKRCTELVSMAKPMHVTFHRAFDETPEPLKALDEVIGCGFDRILTSGKKENAVTGITLISELISAAKEKIRIMPGGGVRSGNISELIKTGAKEFHSSALNLQTMRADENEIRQMKKKIAQ